MSDDILSIFEGLTPKQAKELREKIIPALRELRDKVTQPTVTKGKNHHEHKGTYKSA